jgi:hypothetical protein
MGWPKLIELQGSYKAAKYKEGRRIIEIKEVTRHIK